SSCIAVRSVASPCFAPGSGIFCRKRDDVGLFSGDWREAHLLCLRNTVLASQVPISFHGTRAAVFVPNPPRNGRNIHARLDAPCCEQMPQIMMCDAIHSDLFCT